MAGLPEPGRYHQVLYRGDRAGLEFVAFWLRRGAVVAGMNVNVWDITDDIQAHSSDHERFETPGGSEPFVIRR
jgi:3-phenylpropionate/trans-cinnamate dioxygenase ferredoxin reductase subunit